MYAQKLFVGVFRSPAPGDGESGGRQPPRNPAMGAVTKGFVSRLTTPAEEKWFSLTGLNRVAFVVT